MTRTDGFGGIHRCSRAAHHHRVNQHRCLHRRHQPWIPAVTGPLSKAQASVVKNQIIGKYPGREDLVVISGAAPRSIGAVSIRLPAEAIVHKDEVAFFAIDVIPDDGTAPWRVWRRYSHFRFFADMTSTRSEPFPARRCYRCVGAELEARRKGLELWLIGLVKRTWGVELSAFLYSGRSASPVPRRRLGPSEWFEPSSPSACENSDGLELLHVEVPRDVTSGGSLIVTVPYGRQVNIVVPWGVAPGSPLRLWFDQAAGSLGVWNEAK